jgi:SpoIID/LytB domain protein
MSIDRHALPRPTPARPARWLAACLAAILALGTAAVPALAVDPLPSPGVSTVLPAPAALTPSTSTSPTPALSPSPSPTPSWPTTITTLGTAVTFYGRGYGHGVGMSQYGARGRALAGQTADEILAAYYQGSTPATTDPTQPVRVLVLAGEAAPSSAPLVIVGRGGPWTIDGVGATFPQDARVRAWRTTATVGGVATTTWHIKVLAVDRTILHTAVVAGSIVVRPASSATRLQLRAKPSSADTYRGALKVFLKATSANVVNRLGLDDYLRGVVPVEMPPGWPAAALKAQAIASRSYALRRLHPGTGTFDVYDDTRSQVYRGAEAEKATTNAIIDGAPGAILMSGTSVVNAFYHSTGGGATENNEYGFVGASGAVTSSPVAYLRGILDVSPDGTAYDADAPYFAWATSTLTRAQLSAMFAQDSRTKVGDLAKLDLRRRGVSGRLYQVTLYGSGGTKTVSADVFRAVYDARRPSGTLPLRSNMFDAAPLH